MCEGTVLNVRTDAKECAISEGYLKVIKLNIAEKCSSKSQRQLVGKCR